MRLSSAPGRIRYAHTLTLPASRGRIVDRNGLVLAARPAAPSIGDPQGSRSRRAGACGAGPTLGMKLAELDNRLATNPTSWLRRQSNDESPSGCGTRRPGHPTGARVQALVPDSEAAAHVFGFTNSRTAVRRASSSRSRATWGGAGGSRRVSGPAGRCHRRLGEQHRAVRRPRDHLTIDSKVQFFAIPAHPRRRVAQGAKAAAWSCSTRRPATCGTRQLPELRASDRRTLSGPQLRNRALTDTFERARRLKPFVRAWALATRLVTPTTVIQTAPGA